MLFNSLQFLLFFPVVTTLYFLLPHRFRWVLLLSASCCFYMAFIPVYILVLLFTIIVDYIAGRWIEKTEGPRRKGLLIVSILSNCGVLGFFKYYNFGAGNVGALLACFGLPHHVSIQHLILPIGLSFHTFQAMSYTIEVYRGRQRAERHFGMYALYVMFYPQLVAGPIERPQNLIPQLYAKHVFDEPRVVSGLQRMLWGFFKKIVIADNLSVLVNAVYDRPHHYGGVPLTLATIFFSFQIFCDFSGYSDIAIGAAQIMGIQLMDNFNHPYSATSMAEFWRRWHISLSTWFRDYLYVPLGGNRVAPSRLYLNLFIVFLVSGLWHGANWTFVAWGALHGMYVIGEVLAASWSKTLAPKWRLGTSAGWRAARVAWVFALVSFAWIFFRASNMSDAWYIVTHLGSGWKESGSLRAALSISPFESIIGLAGIAVMESIHLAHRRPGIREALNAMPGPARCLLYFATVVAILLLGNLQSNQFIYFQF